MKDVFISYVARDKEFASTLARAFATSNISFEDNMLTLGDSLSNRIEQGLREAQYGIIILSQAFFRKPWPRYDLDQLATMDQQFDGRSMLLPIWLDISQKDIGRYSSVLARKVGIPVASDAISESIEDAVTEISAVVQPPITKSVLLEQYTDYERSTDPTPQVGSISDDLSRLRDEIARSFSSAELRDLCWDLDIDYDDLPGSTKSSKARELIGYMQRRGLMQKLIDGLKRRRPQLNW